MSLPIHRYGSGEALFKKHSQALTTGMSSHRVMSAGVRSSSFIVQLRGASYFRNLGSTAFCSINYEVRSGPDVDSRDTDSTRSRTAADGYDHSSERHHWLCCALGFRQNLLRTWSPIASRVK
jgi:hypothetical protein